MKLTAQIEKITKQTRAIIAPHLFGLPSNLTTLEKFKVPVIEDCCQSIGSQYDGKKLGSFGKLSIFSFYATKVLTGIDGGMVLTDDVELANSMRDLRYYGGKKNYKVRYNFKLQNLNPKKLITITIGIIAN